MASINSVSTSTSSLYGNRNVLSGLASGMDTESMIENAVSGYQLKIANLLKKQTSLTWKQDAYRSISDKLVEFSRKYTSYSASTNLLSNAFFNNATITKSNGANADSVTATGKTTSDIIVNGVSQLATKGRYQVDAGTGVLKGVSTGTIMADSEVKLDGKTDISAVSGNMSIKYGSQTISIAFKDDEVYADVQAFADAINAKLAEQTITYSGGNTENASDAIKVEVADGKITFSDKKSSGNEVYISTVSGSLAETFGSDKFGSTNKTTTLDLNGKELSKQVDVMEQIAGKSMKFTLDGVTKSITLPSDSELRSYMTSGGHESLEDAMTDYVKERLNKSFGSGKITVTNEGTDALKLSFKVEGGSNLSITSEVNSALGIEANATTALNTGKTLGELLGVDLGGLSDGTLLLADGEVTEQKDGTYKDAAGNVVNADGQRLGKDGELLYSHDLVINGTTIGSYTRDTALETVMLDINKNTEAGISLSYSKTTNQFVFTTQETGAGFGVQYDDGGLASAIFGDFDESNYDEGKDAIVNMTVNGSNLTLTRSSNTFDVDGLSITVNSTFNATVKDGVSKFDFLGTDGKVDESLIKDAVSFTTTTDSDKIVDAIKGFIEGINDIMSSVHTAYTTTPQKNSSGSKYEPLSESDRESMSESAITSYEEKAKQGLLFADRDLSSLYSKLLSAITPTGNDGADLRMMGITTSYSDGKLTLELEETKLRDMLNTNPDKVRDAFTKVQGEGSTTNGIAVNLKKQFDAYASVEGTKGILINKAGSKYSALSLLQNSLKTEIDSYDTQITKWQTKMSSKVDFYTKQFTRLEQLIQTMNDQSSSFAGLMGG